MNNLGTLRRRSFVVSFEEGIVVRGVGGVLFRYGTITTVTPLYAE